MLIKIYASGQVQGPLRIGSKVLNVAASKHGKLRAQLVKKCKILNAVLTLLCFRVTI